MAPALRSIGRVPDPTKDLPQSIWMSDRGRETWAALRCRGCAAAAAAKVSREREIRSQEIPAP